MLESTTNITPIFFFSRPYIVRYSLYLHLDALTVAFRLLYLMSRFKRAIMSNEERTGTAYSATISNTSTTKTTDFKVPPIRSFPPTNTTTSPSISPHLKRPEVTLVEPKEPGDSSDSSTMPLPHHPDTGFNVQSSDVSPRLSPGTPKNTQRISPSPRQSPRDSPRGILDHRSPNTVCTTSSFKIVPLLMAVD